MLQPPAILTSMSSHALGERGASLVEYLLLVSLIALVCSVVLNVLGGQVADTFLDTGSRL